ncbi:hypothetical protein QQX98_000250 [Neonectria punicea]|uniref:DUF8035 domain-containing protein n=1 Tax=Neonectria punicea TaxID=979145 RepID=A0ABR1HU29_9HYPO
MGERWDRDRFLYERNRDQGRDQSRGDDDRPPYMRGGRGGPDRADDRGSDRGDDRQERRFNRSFDDDDVVRDRRYYPEEPRPMPRRDPLGPEYTRRAPPVMERERERDLPRRASPPRRPGFLRRQSSLDTFDRRPGDIFRKHEEYGPPARREDIRREEYRAPPYTPIPLPKARGLPPPARFPDQGFYDDIKIAEPSHYGDDDFRPYPDRVREREYARTRRHRSHSRDSFSTRTRSHRSSSVSSSASSSSSSSGGTTVKSEYPKKGKTRIPSKLVSKRALIDLEYPFFEEGNTIIIQKALGQDNIDELLKVSEDYKKVEMEILASRAPPKAPMAALPPPPPPATQQPPPPPPPAAETRPPPEEPRQAPPPEVKQAPPPPPPAAAPAPAPAPLPYVMKEAPPAPYVMREAPPPAPQAPVIIDAGPPIEDYEETYIREDYSPSRTSSVSSWDTRSHHSRRRRRKSAGPVALFERSRSRSRGGHELRAEIRALERELAHRPKNAGPNREMVHAERLPDGQVVIYEEQVEKVVEHHKPPRIEKDKKGRMSISVPKARYR